jgi:hypothetical protein
VVLKLEKGKTNIVKNWKDYVVDGVDIEKLEKDLTADGWMDESGSIVLIDETGEDYQQQFWQKYLFVFQDDILN